MIIIFLSVVFATGARDGHVMVWDMRCNRRSAHFTQPINIISNAHTDRSPVTPQTTKKKTRKSSTTKPVLVSSRVCKKLHSLSIVKILYKVVVRYGIAHHW